MRWESFIIHLDILNCSGDKPMNSLRIFHYSPWYTYLGWRGASQQVENLSLFTLIYLNRRRRRPLVSWESFIIHLDILIVTLARNILQLRIFHYSPWYTYHPTPNPAQRVENLSLFTLIYLRGLQYLRLTRWESFIIHLDILRKDSPMTRSPLRIFHYSPWYT